MNFKLIHFLLEIRVLHKSPISSPNFQVLEWKFVKLLILFWDFQVLWWKFAKFFMLFSKPQVSFSSNFASLSSVTKDNSSVLFYLKPYILFSEGTNQSVDFWDFWVLRSKFTKFLSFLKQQISYDTEQWCKIWISTDLLFSKVAQAIGWTFIRALKSLKNYTLMSLFSSKHMFQLEYFRGIMYHEAEGWYKTYRKADLWLEKRHEEFG